MSAADVQLAAERIRTGASHRHLVLLCDFDGTLSEFDNDPAAVWLKPERRALLERLASSPGVTLAIVSGRRLDDVKARTALSSEAYYAGLHGLEIQSPHERYLHPELPAAEVALRGLAGPLEEQLAAIGGAFLEDKTHALVAHFRASTADDARRVEEIVMRHTKRALDAGTLRVMLGACMIELMPNIEWHKGSAVQWILDRVGRAHGPTWPVYIGDDLTDEDGFRAVQAIGLSIAASERAAGADLAVDGPSEVEALLRAIAPLAG
ncbi:MAG: trehalose-phosphatase [Vicinamibacterales bacterium]